MTRRAILPAALPAALLAALLMGVPAAAAHAQLFQATPLTEMGKSLYKNCDGGLYGNGQNDIPSEHAIAGLALARSVQPLDTLGRPDPARGAVVLLSVGMSNTSQEFPAFQSLADTFALANRRLVTVNGAQGGQTASIIRNPAAVFWNVIDSLRLRARGLRAAQVQVVWLKEANANPTQAFPVHATMLLEDLKAVVRLLPLKYPNLKLVYISSRIYGGYATTALNPEPYAFEEGFSAQWLVRAQIDGDTSLAYDGPARRAPWLAWGPYLWASGPIPRGDGLTWLQDDFGSDGTHPSNAGRAKVGALLFDFFTHDATAAPWFLSSAATGIDGRVPAPEHLDVQVAPQPVSGHAAVSVTLPHSAHMRAELYDMLGCRVHMLADAAFDAGMHVLRIDADALRLVRGTYILRVSDGSSHTAAHIVVTR